MERAISSAQCALSKEQWYHPPAEVLEDCVSQILQLFVVGVANRKKTTPWLVSDKNWSSVQGQEPAHQRLASSSAPTSKLSWRERKSLLSSGTVRGTEVGCLTPQLERAVFTWSLVVP